jgi:hypothetical protein
MAEGKAVFTAATLEDKRNLPGKDHLGPRDGQQEAQAPITVIIAGSERLHASYLLSADAMLS